MKTTLTTAIFTTILVSTMVAQPPCPGFPGCVYTPAQTYTFKQSSALIKYRDVTNRVRIFEVTLRGPLNRPGALPVVVWAHGGADGLDHSPGALSDWGKITATAGYLSVNPAFHARNKPDQQALCTYLNLSPSECDRLNTPSWDRPYDIRATIDWLESENQDPKSDLYGRVDMNRIAVGGHSAGSSGTLSVAGAVRDYFGTRYSAADPRPRAFVTLSPAPPGMHSLFDMAFRDPTTSWDNVTRPLFAATGEGDAHEAFPHGRRIMFDYLPAGDKYRMYSLSNAFEHAAFGDNLHDCAGISGPLCDNFQRSLVSSVLAFLDFYLLQPQAAMASVYLHNGYAQGIAPGLVEWMQK